MLPGIKLTVSLKLPLTCDTNWRMEGSVW